MEGSTHGGHLHVSKLVPKILSRVQSDDGSTEKANPLHTADAANAEAGQAQPKPPLGREAGTLQAVESGPAHHRGESEAEQHRVEENEPGDGRVGILTQHHQTDQPDSGPTEVELPSGIVSKRHTYNTEHGIEGAHKGVVDIFWILFSGLEFKGTIVSREETRQTNEHFSERRVDVEVELTLQIVGTKLAEAIHVSYQSRSLRKISHSGIYPKEKGGGEGRHSY